MFLSCLRLIKRQALNLKEIFPTHLVLSCFLCQFWTRKVYKNRFQLLTVDRDLDLRYLVSELREKKEIVRGIERNPN